MKAEVMEMVAYAFEDGKKAGREEVLEWLQKETSKCPLYNDGSFIIAKMRPDKWQAKLKEWGER